MLTIAPDSADGDDSGLVVIELHIQIDGIDPIMWSLIVEAIFFLASDGLVHEGTCVARESVYRLVSIFVGLDEIDNQKISRGPD